MLKRLLFALCIIPYVLICVILIFTLITPFIYYILTGDGLTDFLVDKGEEFSNWVRY
jgi:hypothetical protein